MPVTAKAYLYYTKRLECATNHTQKGRLAKITQLECHMGEMDKWRTFLNPMWSACSLKHLLVINRPYFLITPLALLVTLHKWESFP